MSKIRIAEIAIEIKDDDKITYWIYNAGYHPSQGGMEFSYGNSGVSSLEVALDMLKRKLTKDIDEIIETAKKRVEDEQ